MEINDLSQPRGLGGWLTLFSMCWIFVIISMCIGLYFGVANFDFESWRAEPRQSGAYGKTLNWDFLLLLFTAVLLSDIFSTTVKYFRERKAAVSAISYDLLGIAILKSALYIGYWTGDVALDEQGLASAKIMAAPGVIFSTIWYLYFKNSKRVKNTFVH